MFELNKLFKENNIIITKYTRVNNSFIINDEYFVKTRNEKNDETYLYLLSRGFDYFPAICFSDENYECYNMLINAKVPLEQKALDTVMLMSILHNKTSYFKDVDSYYFKKIYEDLLDKLNYLYSYYNDIITICELEVYMSPSMYYFARNYSYLLDSLNYCYKSLTNWYELVEHSNKVRYVMVHNNLSFNHVLDNCIISWNNAVNKECVYDFYNLYKNECHRINFDYLYTMYNSKYQLLDSEKLLLTVLLTMPEKIELTGSEYEKCQKLYTFFEFINKSEKLIRNAINENYSKK